MSTKKVRYDFSFDLGDTVWYKYGYKFVVERIEVCEAGVLYRCGNPGTDDYWAFFESEIGTEAFFTKEEQEKALATDKELLKDLEDAKQMFRKDEQNE